MIQANPFLIEGYKSAEYFCDRQEKTALTASSVQTIVKVLLDRNFLTNDGNIYRVYDHFMQQWLRGDSGI